MDPTIRRLHILLKKYVANSCTQEEFDELFDYIRSDRYDSEITAFFDNQWASQSDQPATHDWSRVMAALQQASAKRDEMPKGVRISRLHAVAIAASVIIAFGLVWNFMSGSEYAPPQPAVALQATQTTPVEVVNTHLTLPDGSVVILGPGSSLDYPKAFTGHTREVTLHGEAYFEVEHNQAKPFIIHTGTVKTTVLGTAFSIKLVNETITVTVAKGRVRVDDKREDKQVADLQPNEQVVYDMATREAAPAAVDSKEAVEWILVDMVFTNMRFDDIVKVLEKRYGKTIRFENERLRSQHITATFDGTEDLRTVLQILCTTHCTEYTNENGIVYIK